MNKWDGCCTYLKGWRSVPGATGGFPAPEGPPSDSLQDKRKKKQIKSTQTLALNVSERTSQKRAYTRDVAFIHGVGQHPRAYQQSRHRFSRAAVAARTALTRTASDDRPIRRNSHLPLEMQLDARTTRLKQSGDSARKSL